MEKISDIKNEIIKQISNYYDCTYRTSRIIDNQLLCDDDPNKFIYQAQSLEFDRWTPEQICHVIQDWADAEPFISINGMSFKLESSCTVTVQALGDSTCAPKDTRYSPSTFELATIIVVGLILLIVLLVVVSLTVLFIKRSRKRKEKNEGPETEPRPTPSYRANRTLNRRYGNKWQ